METAIVERYRDTPDGREAERALRVLHRHLPDVSIAGG